MKIKISAVTDIGRNRETNEDFFYCSSDLLEKVFPVDKISECQKLGEAGGLLVLADGMGGAGNGSIAASEAIGVVRSKMGVLPQEAPESYDVKRIEAVLRECVAAADKAINERVEREPDLMDMGTTLVVCWILGGKAYIAWCGDSRCYLYNRQKGLRCLTKDHSLVQEKIDRKELAPEDYFTEFENNMITRGIGDLDLPKAPDIVSCDLSKDDVLLICSDGLCGYCPNESIEKILNADSGNLDTCRDNLLSLALGQGGDDNICIVLATLEDDEAYAHKPSFWGKIRRLMSGSSDKQ